MSTATATLRKKHSNQMSNAERDHLRKEVGSLESYNFSTHAIEKMCERKIELFDLVACFRNFSVVEFHAMTGEPRVLIRANGNIRGLQVCVVVEPKKKKVVTAYFNKANDRHSTIDWHAYTRSIDVLSYFTCTIH